MVGRWISGVVIQTAFLLSQLNGEDRNAVCHVQDEILGRLAHCLGGPVG
jgi:hypothetical protein